VPYHVETLWLAETNSWLVWSDAHRDECIVVDVPPDPKVVLAAASARSQRIVAVVATHGHVDHVGGIGSLTRLGPSLASLPVHLHHDDRPMLDDPIATSGIFSELLAASGLDLAPPEVIVDLADGDVVRGAGLRLRAIHTPGHTPGSTCLLTEIDGERPVLFSGDHLFAGSVGRTDLPGGSAEALADSMVTRILPLPDELPVLPGHGPATTIGNERRWNPFLQALRS
jgi:hydroxyacylglutathione hydrolase